MWSLVYFLVGYFCCICLLCKKKIMLLVYLYLPKVKGIAGPAILKVKLATFVSYACILHQQLSSRMWGQLSSKMYYWTAYKIVANPDVKWESSIAINLQSWSSLIVFPIGSHQINTSFLSKNIITFFSKNIYRGKWFTRGQSPIASYRHPISLMLFEPTHLMFTIIEMVQLS